MVREVKGFSLLEIIVVISIIGLLSVIAIPKFQTWREKHKVSSETKMLYSLLEKYRSYAFTKKYDIELEVNGNNIKVKRLDDNSTLEQIEFTHPLLSSSNSTTFSINISKRGTFYPYISMYIATNIDTYPDCITLTVNSIRLGSWDGKKCIPR